MSTAAFSAANTNEPLWLQVTLRVAANHAAIAELSVAERAALWEKAIATMKPTADEWHLLVQDMEVQNAYMLGFVDAYRAGLPPMAGWTEARRPALTE